MIFTRDEGAAQTRATLVLGGEIDIATAPALRHIAANLPLRELERLTVDVRDVRFMDSTGVGFLVALRKQMRPGSELVVINPAPMVMRLLQITGLDSLVGLSDGPTSRPRSLSEQGRLDPTG